MKGQQRGSAFCVFVCSFLLVLCVADVAAQTCIDNQTLVAQFVGRTQAAVSLIAKRAQENEYNQCGLFANCSNFTGTFQCANVSATNLTCLNTVPLSSVAFCGNRSCRNQLFGFGGPDFKLPEGVSVFPNSGQVVQSSTYAAAICKQRFTDLYQKLVPVANITSASPFANWRYYGDVAGVTSSFPFQKGAQQQEDDGSISCKEPYDNRKRPWYVGAASAKKSLIILIDVGPSSDQTADTNSRVAEKRLQVSQRMASDLLYTLKVGDQVAVITFGDPIDIVILPSAPPSASPAGAPTSSPSGMLLITSSDPANRPEVGYLNASIYNVTSRSGASASRGLQTAVDQALILLGAALRGCQKNLIIMSDGQGLGAVVTGQSIAASIQVASQQQGQPITPFLFSIGALQNDGDNLMKQLACNSSGVWARVVSTENPLYSMYPYFNFLARTSSVFNGTYYSGLYNDAFGLGRVFTISQPVFSNTTGDFVGVAAGDTSVVATTAYCNDAIASYLTNLTNVQELCTNVTVFDSCLIPAVRGLNNGYCPTPPTCRLAANPTCTGILVPRTALVPPKVVTSPISETRCCETCLAGLSG